MTKKIIVSVFLLAASLCSFFVVSCSKDPIAPPDDSADYRFQAPPNFPPTVYDFTNNPVTKQGFLVGKKVFFDKQFSSDGKVSCASCHTPDHAFSEMQAISKGVQGRLGIRNAPPLVNLAWQSQFFWHGSVQNLNNVPLNAFTAHFEMDETIADILYKINRDIDYRAQFKAAFGIETVDTSHLLRALGQFMVSLTSANSRYDRYKRGESGVRLTSEEQAGLQLFMQHCEKCHKGELFTDFSFRNNGMILLKDDKGRSEITHNPDDDYKFKVPTLRNISHTAPYMHDGSIAMLEDVVDRYQSGVRFSPTLDPAMSKGNLLGFPLDSADKAHIVAFLKTLDDDAFMNNKLFR